MTIFLARPDTIGDRGPLAVKDLLVTAGLRTTYGSSLFADHVPAPCSNVSSRRADERPHGFRLDRCLD